MIEWVCIGLALVAGMASGVQGPANGALARSWDLSRSILLNGAIVFAGTLLGFLFFRQPVRDPAPVPFSRMIGGFCGLTVIAVAAWAVPKIGAAMFSTALLLGMVAASVVVDHFGWFDQRVIRFSALRGVGLALIVGGVGLVKLTAGTR